jgi:hypothetical protein
MVHVLSVLFHLSYLLGLFPNCMRLVWSFFYNAFLGVGWVGKCFDRGLKAHEEHSLIALPMTEILRLEVIRQEHLNHQTLLIKSTLEDGYHC